MFSNIFGLLMIYLDYNGYWGKLVFKFTYIFIEQDKEGIIINNIVISAQSFI